MHLKMSCAKWRPFCPGGDELYASTYQNETTLERNLTDYGIQCSGVNLQREHTCVCDVHLAFSLYIMYSIAVVYFLARHPETSSHDHNCCLSRHSFYSLTRCISYFTLFISRQTYLCQIGADAKPDYHDLFLIVAVFWYNSAIQFLQ